MALKYLYWFAVLCGALATETIAAVELHSLMNTTYREWRNAPSIDEEPHVADESAAGGQTDGSE